MEDLIVGLLGFLLEIIGEFLVELAFELAAEALGALVNRWRRGGPVVSAAGLVFIGAGAGVLSAWLLPHRLIAARAVLPGASLLLAPLATGLAMHFLGKWQRRAGRCPSSLATFRGGALFALSMALIRWLLVGLSH